MPAPLVPIAICLCGGILTASFIPLSAPAWISLGLVCALLALVFSRSNQAAVFWLLLCWVMLGAARFSVWQIHPALAMQSCLPTEPAEVTLHGFIRQQPEDVESAFGAKVQAAVIEVEHVRRPQGWVALKARLQATLYSDAALAADEEVLMEGQWRQVPKPSNPGQYDRRSALARAHITGLLTVKPHQPVVILGSRFSFGWKKPIAALRRRVSCLIARYFSGSCAGILQALVLGEKAGLGDSLKRIFIETGTMHLLVISGANVALIALMVEWILRLIIFSWRLRLAAIAAVLGGYCLLTGSQPPVIRATLMAWIVLGGGLLDRCLCWANVLAAACCVMVLFNPAVLWDASAQLSFAAVASLLIFYPRFEALVSGTFPLLSVRGLHWLVSSIAATIAVWIGLWPILAGYFHLFTPVAILANLTVAPLLSGITVISLILLAAALGCPGLLAGSAWAVAKAVEAAVQWADVCRRIPAASWVVGAVPAWLSGGYYGLLAVSLCRQRLRLRLGRLFTVWMSFAVLTVWGQLAQSLQNSRWLCVDFIDVGHGDSIFIRTPSGLRMLVDAGTQQAGRMRVMPFLRSLGIGSLDALLLTHPDEDHIGGATALLQGVRIHRLFTNGSWDDTASWHSVIRLIKKAGVPQTVLCSGMRLAGDPKVVIEVLHPPCGLLPGVSAAGNDNSVVLRLQDGNISFLLTGDIEAAGLPWLVKNAAVRKVDVLKVPHHGSRLGIAGETFFQAAHPAVAVISVGRAHGLPAKETQAALENLGVPVYTTSNLGAVSLRTDGKRLEMRTFKGSKRRWEVVFN